MYESTIHSLWTDVPLVLMDSFKTHETTAKIIRKYRMHNLTIHTFMQSCYPRIIKVSLTTLTSTSTSTWCIEERRGGHWVTLMSSIQGWGLHSYECFSQDTLQPMPSGPFEESPPSEWYPPGHGDVYHSLYASGLLENLVNQVGLIFASCRSVLCCIDQSISSEIIPSKLL